MSAGIPQQQTAGMAASGPSSLSALLKKSTLDDHEELLAASNAALKRSRDDLVAQQVKAVALVKLDRYDEAVQFIEESAPVLREKATLEYAYALYKIGRLAEAAETASTIKERGGEHLEAQARYRLEDSRRTSEIYEDLRRHAGYAAEEFDVGINQGAIEAQGLWIGALDPASVRRPGREDLEAFEKAYNAACGSIARGELAQAELLLKRAKELCRHSEDLTEEQKADELLPISVQQVYVLQCLGKTSEAANIAKEIKVQDIGDIATRKVAQSNVLLTAPGPVNPFVAHKAFHSIPAIPHGDKLFTYQSFSIESNQNAIDLQAFKFDGIITSTARKLSQHSSPSVLPDALLPSVFHAAALAKGEVDKAAIKKILPELERRPNDVGLILTLVQIYLSSGDITSAIELVESFFKRLDESIAEHEHDVRFNPGLVSILIGLYRRQGRKTHIKQELAKAASYWRKRSHPPSRLLLAAGTALLGSSSVDDVKAASEIFSKLREQQPHDKATLAGYVASHVLDDPASVTSEASKLTSIADLTRDIDVDALETVGIPQSSNALAIAQLGRSRKRAAADGAHVKAKRVRKSRLPKDYDPSKTADPERWVPLRDRSTYRPPKGKKKGKKGGPDRTQGGAVNEDLHVDAAKPAASVVADAAGAGGKKKKGKGKK